LVLRPVKVVGRRGYQRKADFLLSVFHASPVPGIQNVQCGGKQYVFFAVDHVRNLLEEVWPYL